MMTVVVLVVLLGMTELVEADLPVHCVHSQVK